MSPNDRCQPNLTRSYLLQVEDVASQIDLTSYSALLASHTSLKTDLMHQAASDNAAQLTVLPDITLTQANLQNFRTMVSSGLVTFAFTPCQSELLQMFSARIMVRTVREDQSVGDGYACLARCWILFGRMVLACGRS